MFVLFCLIITFFLIINIINIFSNINFFKQKFQKIKIFVSEVYIRIDHFIYYNDMQQLTEI